MWNQANNISHFALFGASHWWMNFTFTTVQWEESIIPILKEKNGIDEFYIISWNTNDELKAFIMEEGDIGSCDRMLTTKSNLKHNEFQE